VSQELWSSGTGKGLLMSGRHRQIKRGFKGKKKTLPIKKSQTLKKEVILGERLKQLNVYLLAKCLKKGGSRIFHIGKSRSKQKGLFNVASEENE
jgi:hypothetical protein